MKTSLFFLVALILSIFCSVTFAQTPKLKVVVVAVGVEPAQKSNTLKALETEVKKAIVKDGRFTAVTRDEAVLNQINREQIYQRSGAVDDKQIRELGKITGAKYICAIKSAQVMESFMLEAEFIEIETANIIAMGSTPCDLVNMGDLMAASAELVRQLLNPNSVAPNGGRLGYGKGVFWDKESGASSGIVEKELVKILRQKVEISDGTCIGGVKISIESDGEPDCALGMIGATCKANASLVITQCQGNQKTILNGSLAGADKYSKDVAAKQMMRKAENAEFWNEWVKEIETRSKR